MTPDDPERRDAAPDEAGASDARPEDGRGPDAPAEAPEGAAPAEEATREGVPPTLLLQDALKLAGFVGTGGQAKRIVQAGEVLVNGEVETRRKRRLRPGDEITVGEETFVLELEDEDEDPDRP